MNRCLGSVVRRVLCVAAVAATGAWGLGAAVPATADVAWEYRSFDDPAEGRQPPPAGLVALQLDDGSAEGAIGINGTVPGTARQFLWFNSFTVPSLPFDLREVWVLFPAEPVVPVGGPVELAIWLDPDGDPTTGAQQLAAFDDTVQAADGTTFSVYSVDPPLRVSAPGRLLVGVVDRFVTSNVSPSGVVAAIDVTASAGRSWIAVYGGDPPDPPTLPADQLLTLVDVFQPGNWMIRAYGEQVVTPGIPDLEGWRVGVLVALIAAAGAVLSVRRGR